MSWCVPDYIVLEKTDRRNIIIESAKRVAKYEAKVKKVNNELLKDCTKWVDDNSAIERKWKKVEETKKGIPTGKQIQRSVHGRKNKKKLENETARVGYSEEGSVSKNRRVDETHKIPRKNISGPAFLPGKL